MHPSLSIPDIIIVAVFVVLTVWLGMRKSRKRDTTGYFLGGRDSSWIVVGLTLFVVSISSSTLVGNAGEGFISGVAVFDYNLVSVFVMVFFALFFIPLYIRAGIYTIPEFLGKRYDNRSRLYLSVITILGNIFIDIAAAMYTGGLILKMMFPEVSLPLIITGIALLAGSTAIMGGLSSSLRVDLFRSAVLICGSVILTIACFSSVGGIGAFIEHFRDDVWLHLVRPVDDPTVPWPGMLLGIPILGFYFWGNNQLMVQRVLSAKSVDQGRKGMLLVGFLYLFTIFIFIMPGMAGRQLNIFSSGASLPAGIVGGGELQANYGINTDEVYTRLIMELLPTGFIGLMIAAMISGLTANIGGALNSVSTIFTMDIYPLLRKGRTAKRPVRTGRIAALTALVISTCWAPLIEEFDSLVSYYQEMTSYLAPPVVGVFLLGAFWSKVSPKGAFTSLMAGFGAACAIITLKYGFGIETGMHFLVTAPILMAACMGVAIIVSHADKSYAPPQNSPLVWSRPMWRTETAEWKHTRWYLSFGLWAALLVAACLAELIIFW